MLLVAPVRMDVRTPLKDEGEGLDRLKVVRSKVPAVTHVDYSARVQTVSRENHPLFHKLISEFYHVAGCPLVVNTSFNIRGEPIVCTPEDAYRCFLQTEMDYLVVGNFILERLNQPTHSFETRQILD